MNEGYYLSNAVAIFVWCHKDESCCCYSVWMCLNAYERCCRGRQASWGMMWLDKQCWSRREGTLWSTYGARSQWCNIICLCPCLNLASFSHGFNCTGLTDGLMFAEAEETLFVVFILTGNNNKTGLINISAIKCFYYSEFTLPQTAHNIYSFPTLF